MGVHVARPLAEPIQSVTCSACGLAIPVPTPRVLHLPRDLHQVVAAQDADQDALRQARTGLLAIAVRLADLTDDLERVMATLDRA